MLLPLKWLREFVPYEGTAEALGARLTMLGLELEGIARPYAEIEGVVVGHVLTRERHPDADKLSVCAVDVGGPEILQIVCGAPNVAAGQKVPVALAGTSLPGGVHIKAAKLRGVPSNGMICSERELGLSEDHGGILVLPADLKVGEKLVDALGLDTEICDISITPNRADCLSVLGLAREVALGFNLPLTLPEIRLEEKGGACAEVLTIGRSGADLCPLYAARVLESATVAPSPAWMRYRLHGMGVRAISNLVDVTNYVMLELGQPLHAFDFGLVRGGKISVRPAGDGEVLTTLDGQERKLCAGDLLICDAERPVALAGVMGGLNSEISDKSTSVCIESAVFRPASVRRTARRLGLSSDASYRFERGVDQLRTRFALDRAAQLMAECSGAVVRRGVAVDEPRPWAAAPVTFRPARARALLAMDEKRLSDAFCSSTLMALGCGVAGVGSPVWSIAPPSHRQDIAREADLIEEVGRVAGIDTVEPTVPQIAHPLAHAGQPESEYSFWRRVRAWATGLGLNEVINYSFVGQQDLDRLSLPAEGRIPVMNPLSEEQNVLRTALAPGLLNTLRHNMSQGSHGVRVFELAHIFRAEPKSDTSAAEFGRLGILLSGRRFEAAWPHGDEELDYQDLKGMAEHLCAAFHVKPAAWAAEANHPYLAPAVRLSLETPEGERPFGLLGRVRSDVADACHARAPVWLAEFDLDLLRRLSAAAVTRFAPLPVFPPVRRDITVIARPELRVEAVLGHVRAMKAPLLEEISLIDVFTPEDGSERRLTFRLTFRHAERTLKDSEADAQRERIANSLVQALSVTV